MLCCVFVSLEGSSLIFDHPLYGSLWQGALGEAFDAALKAVEDGAGAEAEDEGDSPVETARSTVLSGGGGGGGTADTAAAGGGGGVPPHPKLAGSLRHVWFDFHHEVRFSWGAGLVSLRVSVSLFCVAEVRVQV